MTHSISGWLITPIGRNWIESEHIWSPAEQTLSAGYTWSGDSCAAWSSELSSAARHLASEPPPQYTRFSAPATLSPKTDRRSFWTIP